MLFRSPSFGFGHRKDPVYRKECGENLGEDPSKDGSSKSLVLKSFLGRGLERPRLAIAETKPLFQIAS